MKSKEKLIIKNKIININAVIFSLLSLLLILIITSIIAQLLSNNDFEFNNKLEKLLPYTILISVITTIFVFYIYRKKSYMLEIINDRLILSNLKTKQLVCEELISNIKIEYGYYSHYQVTLGQIPIILFQFSDKLIFRCSYKSKTTKPIIMYWEGDNIFKKEFTNSINLNNPNYYLDTQTFTQLAKALIPNNKLIAFDYNLQNTKL